MSRYLPILIIPYMNRLGKCSVKLSLSPLFQGSFSASSCKIDDMSPLSVYCTDTEPDNFKWIPLFFLLDNKTSHHWRNSCTHTEPDHCSDMLSLLLCRESWIPIVGCRAPSDLGFPLLNSRTFNIALETSCHSCSIHRYVRQLERSFAAAAKREGKAELQGPRSHLLRREPAFSFRTRSKSQISEDVYEFNGSSDSMVQPQMSSEICRVT